MKKNRALPALALLFVFLLPILACAAPVAMPSAAVDRQEADGLAAPVEMAAAPVAEVAAMEAPSATPLSTLSPPNDQAYDAMFFKDYGVNPFIDSEDDNLSTFAVDVDTGSYTVSRRYVDDGNIPPSDAVRVEEFVNYFPQGYAYPPEGQAFDIYIDGAPAPFVENENYQMLRVGLQGYAVSPEERKDVALTFVIDVSGSMDQENRLGLVKRALALLVEELRPTDSVAIVVYGSDARVVLEPTGGADKETILRAIYALEPEGATNAEGGLQLGYQMASLAFNPDSINRVILSSDGVANIGNTGAGSIWETIEEHAEKGITLTAVGFGMGNYNDVLMEQLADGGNGFYAYVDDIGEAKRLFVENLTSTLQTIAMDAKVQVEFNPEVVTRYRLVGFENRGIADEQFRDDTVDAGEIGAGHSVTALYEIKLAPEAEGKIATVYMRWQDPETKEVVELNRDFSTEELAASFNDASPHFQWDVVVAEYAEVLRESYWAQDSTLAGVLEEAERVAKIMPEDADIADFVRLVRTASAVSGG